MNAMRKTDTLTDVIHSSMDGIHLVRPAAAQDDQVAAPVSNVVPCTALAAERITAAVLLVMCIAAAIFV